MIAEGSREWFSVRDRLSEQKHRWCCGRRILRTLAQNAEVLSRRSRFLFEIDPEPAAEKLTSFVGAFADPNFALFGSSAKRGAAYRIKQRQRGYDEPPLWKASSC